MKRILVGYFTTILLFIQAQTVLSVPEISIQMQQAQPTAGELIDAVNNLRIAYGLPPLTVNSILMYVAQSQADYLMTTEGG